MYIYIYIYAVTPVGARDLIHHLLYISAVQTANEKLIENIFCAYAETCVLSTRTEIYIFAELLQHIIHSIKASWTMCVAPGNPNPTHRNSQLG